MGTDLGGGVKILDFSKSVNFQQLPCPQHFGVG